MTPSIFKTCHAWAKISVPLVPGALNLQTTGEANFASTYKGKKGIEELKIMALLTAHKK